MGRTLHDSLLEAAGVYTQVIGKWGNFITVNVICEALHFKQHLARANGMMKDVINAEVHAWFC
jgi:hypothetical protein